MQDMPFDSLSYYLRLREAGTPESQAQVQAAALWNVLRSDVPAICADRATVSDLTLACGELRAAIAAVRLEIAEVRSELKREISALRAEISGIRTKM